MIKRWTLFYYTYIVEEYYILATRRTLNNLSATFNMPTYGKLTDHDDSEDWIQYTERMESYFEANEITDADKQRNILLSVMGKIHTNL